MTMHHRYKVTAVNYSFELSEADFQAIEFKYDHYAEEPLYNRLPKLDCRPYAVDYSGHYGPFIFFTLESEHNTEENLNTIAETILAYAREAQAFEEPTE